MSICFLVRRLVHAPPCERVQVMQVQSSSQPLFRWCPLLRGLRNMRNASTTFAGWTLRACAWDEYINPALSLMLGDGWVRGVLAEVERMVSAGCFEIVCRRRGAQILLVRVWRSGVCCRGKPQWVWRWWLYAQVCWLTRWKEREE